ncbi:MAG TPA: glycoside hydrolase family 2 TIM barrel-domain containing protein, partial [Victivallales bacterium]|nr:glycoside hydrolase family 2 TIM barrel-domain containing protein [Victivallales bacterium]
FGGSSSFSFDITRFVEIEREHSIVLKVSDFCRSGVQPLGKQSTKFNSYGCLYTRTTGIWQTVWLEALGDTYIKSCQIIPDIDSNKFIFIPLFYRTNSLMKLKTKIFANEKLITEIESVASDGLPFFCEIRNPQIWSPENPFLYDIEFELWDGKKLQDKVRSYAGMRKVHLENGRFYLNNKPYYLRFVLDQGFYPDGIWTAPSDSSLKNDILLSMKAGFNGARLHQKVFEERFHYWADKLGYLTWAEFPSWGANLSSMIAARNYISEWAECVLRDRNHPSIIAWTPLNETAEILDKAQHNRLHADLYDITKALDPLRPVNDASGYVHVKTDLWTVHNYEQDPEKLKKQLSPENNNGSVWRNFPEKECDYEEQPYIVDEFGGIKWIHGEKFSNDSWGYGEGPKTSNEFYSRLEGQVDALLSLPHICGYCYTQLTDVEQEQNGIYNYDRTNKFDMKKIYSIFSKNPDSY